MRFEDDAVIDFIQARHFCGEIAPRRTAFRAEIVNNFGRLDELIFEKAQKNQSVERPLRNFRQRVAVEFRVAAFEGAGEFFAVFVEFD